MGLCFTNEDISHRIGHLGDVNSGEGNKADEISSTVGKGNSLLFFAVDCFSERIIDNRLVTVARVSQIFQ